LLYKEYRTDLYIIMTNYKLRKQEQLLVTVFKGIVTVTKQNHSSPQTCSVSSLLNYVGKTFFRIYISRSYNFAFLTFQLKQLDRT
jgi:hypothetical protein